MRHAGTVDSKTEHYKLSKPRLMASHNTIFCKQGVQTLDLLRELNPLTAVRLLVED